jgi:hypothetical protein
MNPPRIPRELFAQLQASGHSPPWRCKLHLARGRIVYGVVIDASGTLQSISERAIYSESDLGFRMAAVTDVTLS